MREYERNINYHATCKVCGAPRYAASAKYSMPLCKWHNHEYERQRHAAWREKRKAKAS